MITLYLPKLEDLWFRKLFLSDEKTMSYNHSYGGTITFDENKWNGWYEYWILNNEGKRYYRYLVNKHNEFVGEISYHYDGRYYIANIIIYSKYRNHGYGKEGIKLLCQAAKENGIKELFDDIAIDNPAFKLFVDLGFKEIYRTNKIIMVKKEL